MAEPIKLEFLVQSAEERLPLPDASIDTAVITWTLCSIPDACKALRQLNRVLKINGRLIFVQHGHSCDLGVAVWQERLTPLWKRIGAVATSTARLTNSSVQPDFGSLN